VKIESLRASGANTYEDCAWKYFLVNEIGFESRQSAKTLRGSIVHSCLEILAKARKTGHDKLKDKYIDPSYLLKICWRRHVRENPDVKLTLEDYNFCVSQINYMMGSRFNPLNLKILNIEDQFEITIKKPEAKLPGGKYMKLRGTIDLITELDEETLEIIDYKTGKRSDWVTGEVKGIEKMVQDVQLKMYDLACSVLYKKYKKRIFTLIFTADGGPFTVSFDLDQPAKTLHEFISLLHRIRNDTKFERLKDQPNAAKWKCMYVCQFGRIKHTFADDNGNLLEREYTVKELNKGEIPRVLEEGGVEYRRITFDNRMQCDKYKEIMDRHGLQNGQHILQQIRLDESLSSVKVSRRNDYSRAGISYAEII
jgi:hypothetical protein